MLRVELVASELVAYIRDTSDTITRSEFDDAIATKVFPKCIKNKVWLLLLMIVYAAILPLRRCYVPK